MVGIAALAGGLGGWRRSALWRRRSVGGSAEQADIALGERCRSRFGQKNGDDQAAAFPVAQRHVTAMGFDDLAAQRQTHTGSRLLGREKRQHGLAEHGGRHATAAIENFQAMTLLLRRHGDLDRFSRPS